MERDLSELGVGESDEAMRQRLQAEEIQEARNEMIKCLPYYMNPKYDSSASRRDYRDRFLRFTIENLLLVAEQMRTNSDDQTFWTGEELFAACHDTWVRFMSRGFTLDGTYTGTMQLLRNQFTDLSTREWNWHPEWHFRTYDGYDAPSEDRIVPFDLRDVYRTLDQMQKNNQVETVATPSNLHWSIDKRHLVDQTVRQQWIDSLPKKPTSGYSSDDLMKIIFGPKKDKFPDQLKTNLRYCPDIVPYGQYLAEGDIVWHLSEVEKPALETSKPGTIHKIEGRLVIEPTGYYGSEKINAMITGADREHRIRGTNYTGVPGVADVHKPFWDFLMQYPAKTINLLGYRTLNPTIQNPPTEVFDGLKVSFNPGKEVCETIQELIACYLRINPKYEDFIKVNLAHLRSLIEQAQENQ